MVVTTSSARSSAAPSGSAPRQPDPPQPQRSLARPPAAAAPERQAGSTPFQQPWSPGPQYDMPPPSNRPIAQSTPREPLFLPGSQAVPAPAPLSQADHAILEEAGLDVDNAEELFAMLEDEGEEVDIPPSQAFKPIVHSTQSQPPISFQKEGDGSSTEEDEVEDSFLPSTQARSASVGTSQHTALRPVLTLVIQRIFDRSLTIRDLLTGSTISILFIRIARFFSWPHT